MKMIYKAVCAILTILVVQGYRHYVRMQNHNRSFALAPMVQETMSVKHLDPDDQVQAYKKQRNTILSAFVRYDPSVSGYICHCAKGVKHFYAEWNNAPVQTTLRLVKSIRWKAVCRSLVRI